MCALGQKVNLLVRVPPSQAEEFGKALKTNYDTALEVLVLVDARKAEARVKADQDMIFMAIETTLDGSFAYMNQEIKIQLRQWLLEAGEKAAMSLVKEGKADTLPYAELSGHLGSMLYSFGQYVAAVQKHEKTLEIKLALLGPEQEALGSTYTNLGLAHYSLGNLEKARELQEKALPLTIQSVGEQDEKVASILNNLGVICSQVGDVPTAVSYLERAFNIRKSVLPEGDQELATSLTNLGMQYVQLVGHDCIC